MDRRQFLTRLGLGGAIAAASLAVTPAMALAPRGEAAEIPAAAMERGEFAQMRRRRRRIFRRRRVLRRRARALSRATPGGAGGMAR